MTPAARTLVIALAALCATAGRAAEGELVFVVTAANAMPIGEIENNVLVRGILKDLGEELAAVLQRKPRFTIRPRNRIISALVLGEADVRCYARPEWDDADVHWSKPLIPSGDIVVTRRHAKLPSGSEALAGARVGTVTGYRYGALESALGANFLRDDAPSEQANLRKLAAGRFEYAVANKLTFQYFLKTSPEGRSLSPDYLPLVMFEAQCALSRKSTVTPEQFDRAVDKLLGDRKVDQILGKYR